MLLRRFNTDYEDGNYSVPADHIESEESATQAMVRETLEETSLQIDPSELQLTHLMHRLASEARFDLFFTANDWRGKPKILEPHKCDELIWFPLSNLPSNMVPYVRFGIEQYQKGVMLSEFGW